MELTGARKSKELVEDVPRQGPIHRRAVACTDTSQAGHDGPSTMIRWLLPGKHRSVEVGDARMALVERDLAELK